MSKRLLRGLSSVHLGDVALPHPDDKEWARTEGILTSKLTLKHDSSADGS